MKLETMQVSKFEGWAVTVTIEGSVEEYAKTLLHITNNVRDNRELFKVENYSWCDDITVYCDYDSKDETIEYLEYFGKIKRCEKVLLYQMGEPDFDYFKYAEAVAVPYFE